MALYTDIQGIFEYLISIRKLKNYLSIDIEISNTWKIPKKYASEDKVVEITSKTEGKRSFSFVSDFNKNELDETVINIKKIIEYNKEIELKEELLKQKIVELKKMFETKDLDLLKSLKFDITEERLNNGEEIIDTIGKGN
jgi:uncharacterized protein (DUF2344 family)